MPETKPTLRREQIAGMNIHYIMWSLDYFWIRNSAWALSPSSCGAPSPM